MANKRQRKKSRKQTPIKRITKKQQKEFKRLQKNVKAKIRRTLKKGNSILTTIQTNEGKTLYDYVPVQYFFPDFNKKLSEFTTHEELKAWKEKAKSFTNRSNTRFQFVKNEHGIIGTKQALHRIKNNNKRAINRINNLIEKYKDVPVEGGRLTFGQAQAMLGRPSLNGIRPPLPFEFNNMERQERFRDFAINMENRANPQWIATKNIIYMDNLKTAIEKAFNSDANNVLEKLDKMQPSAVFDLSMRYKEFQIKYYYPIPGVRDGADLNSLNDMESIIDAYFEGGLDFDMSNFPNG